MKFNLSDSEDKMADNIRSMYSPEIPDIGYISYLKLIDDSRRVDPDQTKNKKIIGFKDETIEKNWSAASDRLNDAMNIIHKGSISRNPIDSAIYKSYKRRFKPSMWQKLLANKFFLIILLYIPSKPIITFLFYWEQRLIRAADGWNIIEGSYQNFSWHVDNYFTNHNEVFIYSAFLFFVIYLISKRFK